MIIDFRFFISVSPAMTRMAVNIGRKKKIIELRGQSYKLKCKQYELNGHSQDGKGEF